MDFIRKHKKISIGVLISLIIFLFFGLTYARYFYNKIDNYILESKGFYFNSSVLSVNNSLYKVNNWDGVNSYQITVDVNNKKNEYINTTSDIKYSIGVNCDNTVECSISKTSGIIYEDAKTDSYTITVTPKSNFYAGDEVNISTTVTSSFPYKKSMSATYTLGVEKNKFVYSIKDSVGSKFATLSLTNSVSYYQVETAFSSYKVGDQISLDDYNKLSSTDKNKCFSAKITISFPTDKLRLDMTSSTYTSRVNNSDKFTTINGFSYVSGYTFKLDANSSNDIKFFKTNISNNYTYPIVNDTSIINLSVETAK